MTRAFLHQTRPARPQPASLLHAMINVLCTLCRSAYICLAGAALAFHSLCASSLRGLFDSQKDSCIRVGFLSPRALVSPSKQPPSGCTHCVFSGISHSSPYSPNRRMCAFRHILFIVWTDRRHPPRRGRVLCAFNRRVNRLAALSPPR